MITAAFTAAQNKTPRIRVPEFDPYRRVHVSIPSGEEYVADVRRLIERMSIPTWLTSDDVADLKLATTEACLNAIRHGSPLGSLNTVGITVKPMVDQVVVEVHDEGRGFNVRGVRHRPLPLGETGRGVKLIDSLVDRVDYNFTGHGQSVRLVKRSRLAAVGR